LRRCFNLESKTCNVILNKGVSCDDRSCSRTIIAEAVLQSHPIHLMRCMYAWLIRIWLLACRQTEWRCALALVISRCQWYARSSAGYTCDTRGRNWGSTWSPRAAGPTTRDDLSCMPRRSLWASGVAVAGATALGVWSCLRARLLVGVESGRSLSAVSTDEGD